MNDAEAVQEVGWVAKEARRIASAQATRSEVAEYFERKAALLEHIAGTQTDKERRDTFEMAATARAEAAHVAAGLEWPRGTETLGLHVL